MPSPRLTWPQALSSARLVRLASRRFAFLFNVHHTVCDGRSIDVLFRDLARLYEAFDRGGASPLSPLTVQYKDFAAWQNALLTSDRIERHRVYWHEKLSGKLPVMNLPADYPRPPVRRSEGKLVHATVDGETVGQLRQLGGFRVATLFITLLAVFKILLYRQSGEPDIIVGCPVDGRDHPELENQVGLYVNTLALRDRLAPDECFLQVLEKVRRTALEGYEHQAYPFDRLVKEQVLDRDPSRSPLCDVFINLRNVEPASVPLGAVRLSALDTGFAPATVDLLLDVTVADDRLVLVLRDSTSLFSESRARRLLDQYRELCESILADPEQPIGRLNLLPGSERRRIVCEFNGRRGEYPQDRSIATLFEDQVCKTPRRAAVAFGKQELTYEELNALANRLAHHLQGRGTRPGDIIGLFLDRSFDMIVGMLAILKAGAVYMPIDTSLPGQRISSMLEDSSPTSIVTRERRADRLPARAPHWFVSMSNPMRSPAGPRRIRRGVRPRTTRPT